MTRKTGLVALLTLVVCLMVVVSSADAKLFRLPQEEPAAAAATEVVVNGCDDCCAPKYCIVYRKHRPCRKVCCDPCVQPVQTILQVTDPCTCCPIEVPVCVPGCCTDAPCVTTRCGLFGRTITEYTWCCGFRVKIILSKRDTIVVHTYGS